MTLLRVNVHVLIITSCDRWINVRVLINISGGWPAVRMAASPCQMRSNWRPLWESFCLVPPLRPTSQPPFATPAAMQSLRSVDILNLGSFAHDLEWFDGCQRVYHCTLHPKGITCSETLYQVSLGPARDVIQITLRGSKTEVLQGLRTNHHMWSYKWQLFSHEASRRSVLMQDECHTHNWLHLL